VSQAAKSVDGVKDCKADYKKGIAEVTFVPAKTNASAIAKVIAAKTGYKATVLGGCADRSNETKVKQLAMDKLTFLTREGCVNTVTMRANLDDALRRLNLPRNYQFIDADTLATSDPRGGYGTPTVLYDNVDLFGMPEPPVPHPAPT
jgi:copper chaperone CopZ